MVGTVKRSGQLQCPSVFTRELLETELKRVESDLRDFLGPLGAWTTQQGASVSLSQGLQRRFVETFIALQAVGEQ